MWRVLQGAFKWGLVLGAFAPLISALEFLWSEQAHAVTEQIDDDILGLHGAIFAYAGFTVLVFLALFMIGFVAGLVRGLERRAEGKGRAA